MKVLIVDDHPLFREALKIVLGQMDSACECLEASDCTSAHVVIAENRDLDLVLLDLRLPCQDGCGNGIELMRRVGKEFPEVPIAILSGSEEPSDIQSALNHGALGYIPKSLDPKVMIGALRLILDGGIYVPPHLMNAAVAQGPPISQGTRSLQLTPRQRDIARLLREGKSNKEIARALGVSPETVKVHLATIFRALDVNNRVLAVKELERHRLD